MFTFRIGAKPGTEEACQEFSLGGGFFGLLPKIFIYIPESKNPGPFPSFPRNMSVTWVAKVSPPFSGGAGRELSISYINSQILNISYSTEPGTYWVTCGSHVILGS